MRKFGRGDFLKSILAASGLSAFGSSKVFSESKPLPTLGFDSGLGTLPILTAAETYSVCAENPTGKKGMGGRAIPNPSDPNLPFSKAAADLGQGWKVNPFIKPKARETVTLMDVDGPGVIQHIWMATDETWTGNGRPCVLRFYWDEESTPSVEVPMTDFFAVGHDLFARVNSLAVVVNPTAAPQLLLADAFQAARQGHIHQRCGQRPPLAGLSNHLCQNRDPRAGRLFSRPVAPFRYRPILPCTRSWKVLKEQAATPGPSWHGHKCRTGGSVRVK